MIKVEVEGYCHACLDFSPDVIKPQRVLADNGDYVFTDTIIQCEHKKRCQNIKRYLEQKSREEAVG